LSIPQKAAVIQINQAFSPFSLRTFISLTRTISVLRDTCYEKYEGYGVWAALEKSSQEFIGWFFFKPAVEASYFNPVLANPTDVELGYRLRKASWGKGYATEGARALIVKGFSELGAQRIVAPALSANVASIRVLEKSGLKLQHKFVDETLGQEVVLYALQRGE